MKKLFTILSALAISASLFAQDAPKYSVEIGVNPFSTNFTTFRLDGLKLRYNLDDNSAVRATVNFSHNGSTTTRTDISDNPNFVPSAWATQVQSTEVSLTKSSSTGMSLKFGYEKKLASDGIFQVYYGAEAGYSGYFYANNTKHTENSTIKSYGSTISSITITEYNETSTTKYFKGNGSTNNNHTLVAGIFTGVDVTVYKNLYVGAELALNLSYGFDTPSYSEYKSHSTSKTGTTVTESSTVSSTLTGVTESVSTVGSTTTTSYSYSPVTIRKYSGGSLGFAAVPYIRLGWKF